MNWQRIYYKFEINEIIGQKNKEFEINDLLFILGREIREMYWREECVVK